MADKKAPGHAGDSCEGDEEKNDRKIRRMFFRLRAQPQARDKKRQQYRNRTLQSKPCKRIYFREAERRTGGPGRLPAWRCFVCVAL